MKRTQIAFTFFEVMVTLAIGVIVSAMAVPTLRLFWVRAQDQILQDQLLRVINLAKMSAFAVHKPVVLCASNAISVLPACVDSQPDHLLVFMNENANGILKDKREILAWPPLRLQRGTLHWRSFPRYRRYWLMQPNGILNNDNGTFWHCHDQSLAWVILISKSGRARVVYPDQNGEIPDGNSGRLSCGK
jgi:Tfp pilus assembly protein FimT